jgi:hypothetical protein
MEQIKEYILVNEKDDDITIPIAAIDDDDALYEALSILGWRLASPE